MMTEQAPPAIGVPVPLLLNFREVLFGNGIVVEVHAINGRALCVQEADGCWIYGVNPGGMAAVGDDPAGARREFRRAFSGVLRDLAAEADSFDAFSELVQAFVRDTNRGTERAWLDAVAVVRQDGIEVQGLKKASADAALRVTVNVKALSDVHPTDNEADLHLDIAA
jgi:hypothetical protein